MKNFFKLFALFILTSSIFMSCSIFTKQKTDVATMSFDIKNVKSIKNPRQISQIWKTDTTKKIIPLNELTTLLERNQISPLNYPKFDNKSNATILMSKNQPVIAIEINGISKCYPINMLSYHEIVNDSIGSILFSIAYCPLCNTAYAFNRNLTFNKKSYRLKFGTSGMLRMSNLVMWDEQTETWWQHITGQGIVGKLAGAKLSIFPAKIISLGNFMEFYPKGKIMMPDDYNNSNYEKNPYVKYDSISTKRPFLFFKKVDKRLPAMEYVVSVGNDKAKKVYALSDLQKLKVVNDKIANKNIVIFYNPNMNSNLDTKDISKGKKIGSATVFSASIDGKNLTFRSDGLNFKDNKTKSVWNFIGDCIQGKMKGKKLTPIVYGLDFAFAYLAFEPDAVVYSAEE